MAYKDPDKQREADRERQRRYRRDANLRRDKQGVTDSGRDKAKGVTKQGVTQGVTMIKDKGMTMIPEGTPDVILCEGEPIIDKPKRSSYRILNDGLINIETSPKRGKDIKCFDDLSPSVQQTINTLSDDKAEHKRRTAIAINYQHLFPDRFHSVGVARRLPI